MKHYIEEIKRRGGETVIVGKYGKTALEPVSEVCVSDGLHDGELVLLRAEGWRKYGRHTPRLATLAYLCGEDDNGPWAVRVPGTLMSVRAALNWLVPAAVRKAVAAGKKVRRQGDVYAVESRVDRREETCPSNCEWRPTGYLHHHPDDGRKHRALRVSFKARFIQQTAYGMGRLPKQRRTGPAD